MKTALKSLLEKYIYNKFNTDEGNNYNYWEVAILNSNNLINKILHTDKTLTYLNTANTII
jgi:hypothetical protein